MIKPDNTISKPTVIVTVPNDVVAAIQLNGVIFRWISQFFSKEMSTEMIVHLKNRAVMDEIKTLFEATAVEEKVSQFLQIFESVQDVDSFVLDLAAIYALLFSGVSGELSAYPYQSAYQSDQGSEFQVCETACRKLYQTFGQGISSQFNEPADHLAVQLEFNSYLCSQIGDENLSQSDSQMRLLRTLTKFQSKHLLSWVPDFINRCQKLDSIGIYHLLSQISLMLLSSNQETASRLEYSEKYF